MEEGLIQALEQEKDHLDKVVQMVKAGGQRFRPPNQKKSLSVSDHLKQIARNLDKLSEQER